MDKQDRREGFRFIGYTLAFLVSIAALGVFCTFLFGGGSWLTAPFRGASEKREQTTGSGAFRIATYQRYFDLCTAVQNAEASLKALEEEKPDASDTRKAQIATSATAIKAQRAASVNEYNSMSAQEHREPFKDKNLPYKLDVADTATVCN